VGRESGVLECGHMQDDLTKSQVYCDVGRCVLVYAREI
jgi:hypothetical protein